MRKPNARNSFQRGKANVYTCGCCNRKTRGAGDAFGVTLCAECYELVGIENTVSDYGVDDAFGRDGYNKAARKELAKLATHADADLSNWSDLVATLDAWDARNTQPSHPACVTVTTVQGLKVDINFDRTADVCWSCVLADEILRDRSLERIMTRIAEYIGRTEF